MKKSPSRVSDLHTASIVASACWLYLAFQQGLHGLETRSILPILLAAESSLVTYRMIARLPDRAATQSWRVRLVVWASVLLPLLIRVRAPLPLPATVIACLGAALTVWALLALGESFGITPADRGLAYRGPYRYLRHPMYLGALLVAGAAVFGSLNFDAPRWQDAWNLVIFGLVLASAIYRIRKEEGLIQGYSAYTKIVRWRMIPGVW
jgi:protein-S-isoprenylcysteine O-methyltransferase Ste14